MKALISLAALVLTGAAWAQAPQVDADARQRYATCVAGVEVDPEAAFEEAIGWRSLGGGAPARHCAALALLALGAEEEAASRLEALALRPDAGGADARAAILAQAANAWMLAEAPDAALESLAAALELAPNSSELHRDAARAHALKRDWAAAAHALNEALARDPRSSAAHALMARAKWELGEAEAAREHVRKALAFDPENLDALVVRGELRQAGAM